MDKERNRLCKLACLPLLVFSAIHIQPISEIYYRNIKHDLEFNIQSLHLPDVFKVFGREVYLVKTLERTSLYGWNNHSQLFGL